MSHHHHHRHHHHPFFLLAGAAAASGIHPPPPLPTPRLKSGPSLLDEVNGIAKLSRAGGEAVPKLRPLDFSERSANELRPSTFDEMVGQERLRPLLERLIAQARTGTPLDHILLIGSAGTGKTTTAMVMAHELGRPVYMLKAPIAQDVLEELAQVAGDGDIVIVDECHLWVKPDRRGVNGVASPEQVYGILEDKRLQTATGVLPFPDVTFIGCTTTTGSLPEPFLARFPLQPRLDAYTVEEMATLARANAQSLSLSIDESGALMFARASRGVPRIVNRFSRNARSLAARHIDDALAHEIIVELNGSTLDGLDTDMQAMLRFLLRCKRTKANGEVVYQAGLNTIATALGKSRDSQIIALAVEPWLISRGYVAVTPTGRCLTAAGVSRTLKL